MPSITWKRGLLRAWIVMSAIWVLAIGYIQVPQLIASWPPIPTVRTVENALDTAKSSFSPHPPSKSVFFDSLKFSLKFQEAKPTVNVDLPVAFQVDENFYPNTPSQIGGFDAYFYVKGQQSVMVSGIPANITAAQFTRSISHYIWHIRLLRTSLAASWILLPPTALFILGALLVWVMAGFVRSTSKA